jgi:hypothetical protein
LTDGVAAEYGNAAGGDRSGDREAQAKESGKMETVHVEWLPSM